MTKAQPFTAEQEQAILFTPKGIRFDLITIAVCKRALQYEMKAAERLATLERLGDMTSAHMTAAMVAAIEPISALGFKVLEAASVHDHPGDVSLGRRAELRAAGVYDSDLFPSYAVLTGEPVFKSFLRSEPSILTAIMLGHRATYGAKPLPIVPPAAEPTSEPAAPPSFKRYQERPAEFPRSPVFAPDVGEQTIPRPKDRPAW